MWCPDVYEGAPTPITAFFSVGPKAAGFAMLIRFVKTLQIGLAPDTDWQIIFAILAIFSMALGNFAALLQQNLKRLLAYSCIAHAGYILLAFVIFQTENVASVMFYLLVYLVMNLGAFLVVILFEEKFGVETVDGCKGLGWSAPGICAMMSIFLFSLTGLPPFAGFIGKLLLFGYVIESGALGISLVVIAVLFSVISLYYYARIVSMMFLAKPTQPTALQEISPYYLALLWILVIPTIVLGIYWGGIFAITISSAKTLFIG
jgi:NADH-quinone oxidoreductase subunit N